MMLVRPARFRLAISVTTLLLAFSLAACARDVQAPSGEDSPERTPVSDGLASGPAATETPLSLPTLLPTATRFAAAPTATGQTPSPTSAPQATVDFDQPVVELRYQIPALDLDRRLEGDVSGRITVVDETRGVAAIRQNQGGVLLELQQVLPTLDLQQIPENCDTCVLFSFDMALEEVEGDGWLKDAVLLASVENYTAALLGPHFPPGTTLGLRRSATAYDVAHTLALDESGMLFRWLATEAEVEQAVDVQDVAPEIPSLLDALDAEGLQEQYAVDCMSAPLETLYLRMDDVAADDALSIRVVCPAFSLPASLLPLYLQLDRLLQETLEGSGLPRPPSEVALDAVLDYRRQDGAHLELTWDGTVRISRSDAQVVTPEVTATPSLTATATVTGSLPATTTTTLTATLSASQVMSVTTALLESDLLQPGLESFAAAESENILLVRGELGMMELAWASGQGPTAITEQLAWLDDLLETE